MTHCTHIRVRNFNEHAMDVEAFIKYIEKKYSMDVRDLPQWKELVDLLHHNTTDYKRAVHASKERKKLILDKILIQTTRKSPFELTDDFSRTYKVWEDMKIKTKTKKSLVKFNRKSDLENGIKDFEREDTLTNIEDLTAHPNSEVIEEDAITTRKGKIYTTETEAVSESHLPAVVCVNKHKMVSPLESKDSRLSYRSYIEGNDLISEKEFKEWLVIKPTACIQAYPAEFYVINSSMEEQKILFYITNCGTEYKHIRFVTVTDTSQFKYIKISPLYPVKLIPGISAHYCLRFKLIQNTKEFSSALFFRIGQNVVIEAPGTGLLIPIKRRLIPRSVSITDVVNLPPAYPWHISGTIGYPTGTINILCKDPYNYEVKITKRALEYDKEPEESELSVQAVSLNTESVQERKIDDQIEERQVLSGKKGKKNIKSQVSSITKSTKSEIRLMEKKKEALDIVFLIIEEIISTALDSFKIDRKNLELRPYSKETITVCFTKHEYIGYHQCFYDVDVYDLNSRELLMTKPVQVRIEVLPHPVSIYPTILDMSATAIVTHGFVEDKIVFYNNHRIYPVYVKVKLTTKMRKIFEVAPSELVVHPLSSGPVIVRFCTRSFLIKNVTDELAFFTVKILYSGNHTVYTHVPPVFYEIIAPCAFEFKKYYNEKYYKQTDRNKNRGIKSPIWH